MQLVQSTINVSAQATGVTAGVVLASNERRVYAQVQNIGANPVYLLMGSGTASAANCHEILKAGTAATDGTGGIFKTGTVVYTGAITVGGTAPTCLSYEIAP
jgi:hypothetical protein